MPIVTRDYVGFGEEKPGAMVYLTTKLRVRLTDPQKIPIPYGRCRIADEPDTIYECDDRGVVEIPINSRDKSSIDLEWELEDAADNDTGDRFYWHAPLYLGINSMDDSSRQLRLAHLGIIGNSDLGTIVNEQEALAYDQYLKRGGRGVMAIGPGYSKTDYLKKLYGESHDGLESENSQLGVDDSSYLEIFDDAHKYILRQEAIQTLSDEQVENMIHDLIKSLFQIRESEEADGISRSNEKNIIWHNIGMLIQALSDEQVDNMITDLNNSLNQIRESEKSDGMERWDEKEIVMHAVWKLKASLYTRQNDGKETWAASTAQGPPWFYTPEGRKDMWEKIVKKKGATSPEATEAKRYWQYWDRMQVYYKEDPHRAKVTTRLVIELTEATYRDLEVDHAIDQLHESYRDLYLRGANARGLPAKISHSTGDRGPGECLSKSPNFIKEGLLGGLYYFHIYIGKVLDWHYPIRHHDIPFLANIEREAKEYGYSMIPNHREYKMEFIKK